MKKSALLALLIGCFCIGTSFAQKPANAPEDATGLCKDGTYYTGKKKQGACRGHKGVQTWYGVPSAQAATPTPPTQVGTAPDATVSAATAPAKSDMVWVNPSKKVYHCPNTRWYGKTKQGEYMSEADAKAKGFQPNRDKPCAG